MPRITFNNNNNAKLSSNVPNLTGTLSNTVIQVGSSADMSNYYDKEDVDGLLENKSDTDHDHYVKTGLLEYNLQEAFEFLRDNTMPETQVKWLIGQYAAPKDHDHYVKLGLANLSLQAAYDGLKKELKDLRDTVSQLVTVVEPKSEYYVEYTLAEPMTTFDMRSTEPTVSSEGYLPNLSHGSLFTKINLKDGSATVNMNTPVSEVESIRIYYPEDTHVVQFANKNVKRVNYIKGNNLGYLDSMFYECTSLEYADLRSLNTANFGSSTFVGVPSEAVIRMPSNTPESWDNFGFTGQFVLDITGFSISPTEMTITEPGTHRVDITVNEPNRPCSFIANSAYGYCDVIVHQEPGIQPYVEITRTDPVTFNTYDIVHIEESNSGLANQVSISLANPYISGFGFEPSQISLDNTNGYSAFCQIMPYETGKPMEFEFVSSGSNSNNVHVTVDGTQVHIISNTYVYESFGICIREKYSQTENYIQVTVYDKPLQSITPDVTELTFTKGVSGVQTIMLELDPGSTERNLTYMTMDQLATDFEFEIQDMGGSPIPLAVTYTGGSTTGSFTVDVYDTNTQIHAVPITIKVIEAGQEEPEGPYITGFNVEPSELTINSESPEQIINIYPFEQGKTINFSSSLDGFGSSRVFNTSEYDSGESNTVKLVMWGFSNVTPGNGTITIREENSGCEKQIPVTITDVSQPGEDGLVDMVFHINDILNASHTLRAVTSYSPYTYKEYDLVNADKDDYGKVLTVRITPNELKELNIMMYGYDPINICLTFEEQNEIWVDLLNINMPYSFTRPDTVTSIETKHTLKINYHPHDFDISNGDSIKLIMGHYRTDITHAYSEGPWYVFETLVPEGVDIQISLNDINFNLGLFTQEREIWHLAHAHTIYDTQPEVPNYLTFNTRVHLQKEGSDYSEGWHLCLYLGNTSTTYDITPNVDNFGLYFDIPDTLYTHVRYGFQFYSDAGDWIDLYDIPEGFTDETTELWFIVNDSNIYYSNPAEEEPKKDYKCPRCSFEFDADEAIRVSNGRIQCPDPECGYIGKPTRFTPDEEPAEE